MEVIKELEIGKGFYRIGKLDVWTSFHVFRRLTPILGALYEALGQPQSLVGESKPEPMLAFVAIARQLSSMEDADVDYILKACLKVAQRRDGTEWFNIMNSSGVLMRQDMGLPEFLEVTAVVIQSQEGLSDFFTRAESSLKAVEAVQLNSSQPS